MRRLKKAKNTEDSRHTFIEVRMTHHFEPEYEALVNRVVEQLSINKDHARERIDRLIGNAWMDINYTPNRKKMTGRDMYLQTGDKKYL